MLSLVGCQATQPVVVSPVSKTPGKVVNSVNFGSPVAVRALKKSSSVSKKLVTVRNPPEGAKYRLLGLEYQKDNRLTEAIQAMEKSVELDPKNAIGKINLGWALHLANRDREARKILEQVTQEHPDNVSGFNALGIVYLVMGDLTKAVATHTRAVKLEKDDEIAHYNLSLAYHLLGKYETAILEGKKAAQLEPSNPHPQIALALNFWTKGGKEESQRYYNQAIALDSRYRNSDYLEHLKEAGFNPAQIQTLKKILESLK